MGDKYKYAPKFLFDAPVLWLLRLRRMVWAYVIISIYVSLNLLSNTYYYARHFPYIDDNRVMLVDFYMDSVSEYKDDYGDYHFAGDILKGSPSIYKYHNSSDKSISIDYMPYGYNFIDEVDGMYYKFDRNFHLLKVFKLTSDGSIDVNLSNVDEDKVREAVFEFMDPLLDTVDFPAPLINLQWLFNLRHMNSYECVKKCL